MSLRVMFFLPPVYPSFLFLHFHRPLSEGSSAMKSVSLFLTFSFFLFPSLAIPQQSDWKIPSNPPLVTRWTKDVNPKNPLPEYPRPQMVRAQWMNLNGLWEFVEATEKDSPPFGKKLGGAILVPFPIESALSGVMKHVDRLWYRRTFEIPKKWSGQRILLHFGAVDWETSVYVNGTLIGSHRGGYDPFSFDMTDALKKNGAQEILVGVYDPTDSGDQPRGKQVLKPGGIWYTPTTGIWQTVWIEPVPEVYISRLRLIPDPNVSQFRLFVETSKPFAGISVAAQVRQNGKTIASVSGLPGSEFSVSVPSPILWSPDNPFLYDLHVVLIQNGKTIDAVESYSGLRRIEIARDNRGINRIFLNGKEIFLTGPLDQGFWPDGIYTAPTDEALRYDIEITKKLGFNMARKHVKVEPLRWYYWADKLGLLVWQDMPSANNKTDEGKKQFELELQQLIRTHENHPSIMMWVVFNEGWGQYDTERLTAWVKKTDPARLVNNASGWTDKNAGDVNDIHSYPKPKSPPAEPTRAVVLGEFGGLGLALEGHTWQKEHWGYQGMKSTEQLTSKYESFLRTVYDLKNDPGLCAAVYTQTTDVEVECNGLLTYDRAVIKPDADRIARVNRGDFSMVPPSPVLHIIVPTSQERPQMWRYTFEQPSEEWINKQFDDSKWQSGPGGFGTKQTPGTVVGTEWTGNDIWMRRSFSIENPDTDSLAFLLHHDEDVEIYINGSLAAAETGWTSEYELFEIGKKARVAIQKGENVIALHCKQTGGGQYIDVGIVRVERPRNR